MGTAAAAVGQLHSSIANVSFVEELLEPSEGKIIHKTYVIHNNNYMSVASTIMLTYRP